MTIDPDLLVIQGSFDKPLTGMWHCGPNKCWVKITHLPTMISVRHYGKTQHKIKESALAVLEMLVDECDYDHCNFPESTI